MFRTPDKKLLSTHMPFLAKSRYVNLVSWNITRQMHNETDSQYQDRLFHIAAQLKNITRNEKPSFICLQQGPETEKKREEFGDALKKDELKNYNIAFFANSEGSTHLVTLFETRNYIYLPELTEILFDKALEGGLKDRIMPLVFLEKVSNEKLLVMNVNANEKMEIKRDINALFDAVIDAGIEHMILIGDFNRDLTHKADDVSHHDISRGLNVSGIFEERLYTRAMQGGSFNHNQVIETRDGVMSSFLLEPHCLLIANSPDVMLSFTKEATSCIRDVPEHFFEGIKVRQERAEAAKYISSSSSKR